MTGKPSAPSSPSNAASVKRGVELYRWGPQRSFTVVDAAGVVERHEGIGLELDAVVGFLNDPPGPIESPGFDLVVFDGPHAAAVVHFPAEGLPRVTRLGRAAGEGGAA